MFRGVKMMKKIDLHIHTKFSADGTYEPEQIVEMAAAKNMDLISITDHNSVSAVKCAMKAAEKTSVRVVPGVELDCVFEGINLHMTAYGIDVEDVRYAKHEKYVHDQFVKGTWDGTRRLMHAMGIEVSDEELLSIAVHDLIVPEDFAMYLLTHSEFDHLEWLKPYRKGGSRCQNPALNFYWDFFSQGKIGAYGDVKKPAEEIIELIHETGGIAVIAHPGQNFKHCDDSLERLLQKVDGIEVYSSYHSEEDVKKYRELALKHKVLISAGTDYHGYHKPLIELGRIDGLDEKESEALYEVMERLIK